MEVSIIANTWKYCISGISIVTQLTFKRTDSVHANMLYSCGYLVSCNVDGIVPQVDCDDKLRCVWEDQQGLV